MILSDDILAPIKYKEIYNELINSSKAYASFLGPNGHSRTLRQVPNNLDEAYMLILIIRIRKCSNCSTNPAIVNRLKSY